MNTSISFTFDSAISPLAAVSGCTITDSAMITYPASAAVSRSTVTITPVHALAQNSAITVALTTQDLAGRYAAGSVNFTIGANAGPTSFQVAGVSPPDGAAITTRPGTIRLTFSRAFNAATLAAGITLYSNGTVVSGAFQRSNNDLSLMVTPSNLTGPVTIVAGSTLTDLGGNPVAPFRASYTFSVSGIGTTATTILAMRPPGGATGVLPASPITWFFSGPVDLPTVQSSLLVLANGDPQPGIFQLSPDGTILTYYPTAPLPAGSTVRFYQYARRGRAGTRNAARRRKFRRPDSNHGEHPASELPAAHSGKSADGRELL